ncbi:UDP-N-acetylmuramate dehydrogenase [Diaminobutyricimonas sp. TR449]|uniref:UDP-N-acetylmuramate dehydrogenase n=1 Tax=Diaminobutyricimonas sp. TR449 TaxID=2708076 RepID=UPI001FB86992|nr:UDP-N-acetylmuramate dehydrogenase [Diaminobutyricimonas sp. TR449]
MTLAELTTLQVGGPAERVVAPLTTQELIRTTREVWASGEDWLLLGGGSNVVIADEGFDGTVIRVVNPGIEVSRSNSADVAAGSSSSLAPSTVRLRVQAGQNWDELVAWTVENGWAGIEALSGIPGSVGAAPIQNIGAYGQEVASALVAVDFLDYQTGELEHLEVSELGLGYRTSAFKRGRLGLVLAVEFELRDNGGASEPIAYSQLASALGVSVGDRVAVTQVREAVLALRSSKGMVLNPEDPDSVSAGSFFTNPIVSENFARSLPGDAPRWSMEPEVQDVAVPLGADPAPPPAHGEPTVKLSAAWLIEQSGISRGYRLPGSRAAVSSKHTLAITNTGGATATEIVQLAEFIQTRVLAQFGVSLQPEPVFVGVHG